MSLIYLCFALSGLASLMFQVVWVRSLLGVFGSSSLAVSTVLATFMAGLALGSLFGGRIADARWAQKLGGLRLYGACEILVAASAWGILALIRALHPANAWLWAQLGDHPFLLAAARFVLCAGVLLIPTTAMGATLPLLSKYLTREVSAFEGLGRRLATLYAMNTLGALVGAALAGFVLLAALGVSRTSAVAAGIAALVGALAILIGSLEKGSTHASAKAPTPLTQELPPASSVEGTKRSTRLWVCWIYAGSGFLAMALEVLWSRSLSIVIGSSTYSFTLVLCVFLAGISLGSAAVARFIPKPKDAARVMAWIFVWVAGCALAAHRITDNLPSLFLELSKETGFALDTIFHLHALLIALVVLPLSLGLGAIMPLAIQAYSENRAQVGRDVGAAYAANTLGAIVGAASASFVLMPALGIEGSSLAAVFFALALAAASFKIGPPLGKTGLWVAAAMTVIGALAVWSPPWNQSRFTAGLFRTHQAREYIKRGGLFDRNVVFYQDGMATTVSVEHFGQGYVLRNNGKVEASSKLDMPTQILVGLLPVLAHGGPKQKVFIVGYGSGVTVGAAAVSPLVKSIDVVELEPYVYQAADAFFDEFNHAPQRDPKVIRHVGDGRNLLLSGDTRFDVIVSEPSNPWIAGISSLFTRDFYSLAKAHLAPGGVYCQWAQLYELGPVNVKTIYRTFAESFEYVYALTPGDQSTDTLLLGSDSPIDMSIGALSNSFRSKDVRDELLRANVGEPSDIIASLFLGPEDVDSFSAGAPVNTDDNVVLEHSAPFDLLSSQGASLFTRTIRSEDWPYGKTNPWLAKVRADDALSVSRSFAVYGRLDQARDWLAKAPRGKDSARFAHVLALSAPKDITDPEVGLTLGAGGPLPPSQAVLFRERGEEGARTLKQVYHRLSEGEWFVAWELATSLPPRADTPQGRDVTFVKAYLAFKSLNLAPALKLFQSLEGEEPRRPALIYYMARTQFGLGRFRSSIQTMEKFADLDLKEAR